MLSRLFWNQAKQCHLVLVEPCMSGTHVGRGPQSSWRKGGSWPRWERGPLRREAQKLRAVKRGEGGLLDDGVTSVRSGARYVRFRKAGTSAPAFPLPSMH